MRILILAPHPFYQDRGTPMDVDLLVRALSSRGDQVDLVTYHEGEDREYANVTHHRISAPRWLKNIRPGFSLRKLFCDLLLFWRAWGLMRKGKYDFVHAGEEAVFIAMLFKRGYGVPYVYDMDSSIAQQLVEKIGLLRPLAGLFNWCEARAIKGSMAVAPVCNALADLAVARGAETVVTLHDISQLCDEDFQPDPEFKERLKVDGKVAMYVGNLEKYQGVDLLLDSLPLARKRGADIDVVIAGGQQQDIATYKRKAASLGVGPHVHFLGPWPARQLGGLLASADILVAPRIKGVNTPMKIFPYLHSGRPVLVTDLPTHTQLLDNSVAMLASPEPSAFADAMVQLVGDDKLRHELGRAGHEFVESNHTFAQYKKRVDRLIELVAKHLDQTSSH